MKLAVDVAAESIVFRSLQVVHGFCLALATAGLLFAGTAQALDGIDLSASPEAAEEGAVEGCPRLIQIKYPFLKCTNGQIGLAAGDDTWENSRRIPMQSEWTEGNGVFGPELNMD
jgi:hypothetical protein